MNAHITTTLAILLAALQAAIAAALGAQIAGFVLPPAAVFGLVVISAPIAVVLANLPPVARLGSERAALREAQVSASAPSQPTGVR